MKCFVMKSFFNRFLLTTLLKKSELYYTSNCNIKNIYIEIKSLINIVNLFYMHSLLQLSFFRTLLVSDFINYMLRFLMIYNVISLAFNNIFFFKVLLSNTSIVHSIVELYYWDLYGVFFYKNLDLRRILNDYGFFGHSFKKYFPLSVFSEFIYLYNYLALKIILNYFTLYTISYNIKHYAFRCKKQPFLYYTSKCYYSTKKIKKNSFYKNFSFIKLKCYWSDLLTDLIELKYFSLFPIENTKIKMNFLLNNLYILNKNLNNDKKKIFSTIKLEFIDIINQMDLYIEKMISNIIDLGTSQPYYDSDNVSFLSFCFPLSPRGPYDDIKDLYSYLDEKYKSYYESLWPVNSLHYRVFFNIYTSYSNIINDLERIMKLINSYRIAFYCLQYIILLLPSSELILMKEVIDIYTFRLRDFKVCKVYISLLSVIFFFLMFDFFLSNSNKINEINMLLNFFRSIIIPNNIRIIDSENPIEGVIEFFFSSSILRLKLLLFELSRSFLYYPSIRSINTDFLDLNVTRHLNPNNDTDLNNIHFCLWYMNNILRFSFDHCFWNDISSLSNRILFLKENKKSLLFISIKNNLHLIDLLIFIFFLYFLNFLFLLMYYIPYSTRFLSFYSDNFNFSTHVCHNDDAHLVGQFDVVSVDGNRITLKRSLSGVQWPPLNCNWIFEFSNGNWAINFEESSNGHWAWDNIVRESSNCRTFVTNESLGTIEFSFTSLCPFFDISISYLKGIYVYFESEDGNDNDSIWRS